MASILLDRVWLIDAAAPATAIALLREGDREFGFETPGRVERYAGGRLRATSQLGTVQSAGLTVNTDPAGLALLQSWADGRTLLYRDGLGTRLWVACFSAPWRPSLDGRHRTVELTLQQVTHEEAV